MNAAMHERFARALLATAVTCLGACTSLEPAEVPQSPHQSREPRSEPDHGSLDRRRLGLQRQLLSELRKLRENRQASTTGVESPEEAPNQGNEQKLLVFGGVSHEVFLGCLCDELDRESVFNLAGEFGSDLSVTSLRNKFAPYGSDRDDTSTCNPTATRPPLVITSDGKSLGLLTTNAALKKRITAPSVTDWLARMCAQ